MNMGWQMSLQDSHFIIFGYIFSHEIAGSYGSTIFNYFKKLHLNFYLFPWLEYDILSWHWTVAAASQPHSHRETTGPLQCAVMLGYDPLWVRYIDVFLTDDILGLWWVYEDAHLKMWVSHWQPQCHSGLWHCSMCSHSTTQARGAAVGISLFLFLKTK